MLCAVNVCVCVCVQRKGAPHAPCEDYTGGGPTRMDTIRVLQHMDAESCPELNTLLAAICEVWKAPVSSVTLLNRYGVARLRRRRAVEKAGSARPRGRAGAHSLRAVTKSGCATRKAARQGASLGRWQCALGECEDTCRALRAGLPGRQCLQTHFEADTAHIHTWSRDLASAGLF